MRIHVANYQVVEREGSALRMAPGWYDLPEALARELVESGVASLTESAAANVDPGPGVMHSSCSKGSVASDSALGPGSREAALADVSPVSSVMHPAGGIDAPAREGTMHAATNKERPAAGPGPSTRGESPLAQDAASDEAAGLTSGGAANDAPRDLTMDAGGEFNQDEAGNNAVQTSANIHPSGAAAGDPEHEGEDHA